MADKNEFEFVSDVSRKSRHIKSDNFDEYASNENLNAYIKSLNRHEFVSLSIVSYPSSFDAIISVLKTKFEYRLDGMQDILIYHGLIKLWQCVSKTEIIDIVSVMKDVIKYVEVPRSNTKYLYQIDGDLYRKVLKVSPETAAFCNEIAAKLNVTASSIGLLSLLISLRESPTIFNDYESVSEKYLFNLRDNIYSSFKSYLSQNLQTFRPYSNHIHRRYNSELLKNLPDTTKLASLYNLLKMFDEKEYLRENLLDYRIVVNDLNKIVTGKNIDIYSKIENDFSIVVHDEPDEPEPQKIENNKVEVHENDILIETSKEASNDTCKKEECCTVIEPSVKSKVIEKTKEKEIKSVIKHLINLILISIKTKLKKYFK